MTQAIVTLRNLNKSFDNHKVLRDINLDIIEGESISIIGRSGCGKTTLLRCIAGLEMISSGNLNVNDCEINIPLGSLVEHTKFQDLDKDLRQKIHILRQNVGFLFQHLNLFPHKTVLENVSIAPLVVSKISKEEARHRAIENLDKVGMKHHLQKIPSELSGGEAQRVAIARALAMQPKVMLYDEPTSALDPELVGELLQVMKDLKADGMTQIVVTHMLRFAMSISDKVIYMDSGAIEEMDSPQIIFDAPRNEKTSKYIGSLLQ